MLETVREFGLEQLTLAGELDDSRERHARHFLTLTARVVQGIQIFMDLESISRVALEQDNVRLALSWFDEQGEIEALLGLSSLLYGLWLAHGQYGDGLRWLERALERSSHTASAGRVQALVAAGMLATYQGDYAQGEELLNDGYRRLNQLGDDVPGARADTGFALLSLGSIALAQEQFDRAEGHLQGALERFQLAGNDWGIGEAQDALGAVSYCTGNGARAALLYAESLDRARHIGDPLMLESSLHGLAGVAAESGRPEAGARLLGAAERIIASLGAPAYPRDQPVRSRALAALMAALGEERLATGREAGWVLTLDAVIAEAQAVAETVISSG
jgi:tetratricopeptide (TPR) repeat protein